MDPHDFAHDGDLFPINLLDERSTRIGLIQHVDQIAAEIVSLQMHNGIRGVSRDVGPGIVQTLPQDVAGCGGIAAVQGFQGRLANVAFAGIPIGLVLTLIHLVSIPVTNTSVNPARSIGPAIFVGGWALSQLWLFIVAPLAGGLLGALVHRLLFSHSAQIAPGESAVEAGA